MLTIQSTVKTNKIINKNDLKGLKLAKAFRASPENALSNLLVENKLFKSSIMEVGSRLLHSHDLIISPY